MSSSNFIVESCKVDSEEGVKLHTRIFKHRDDVVQGNNDDGNSVGIASELACKGFWSVTFDTRGAGKSTGRATLTGFAEVKDVVSVCRWLVQSFDADRILLVGSSAGKSCPDDFRVECGDFIYSFSVSADNSVSCLRHELISVSQLKKKLKSAAGRTETHLIEGVSHFQMEGPEYDSQMADVICNFISSL
ncbi:unnamed protein product [Eruca vesicaria subsp. sativa]|uniref:Xaa-Pro dipeptidyl-peptidase-like domain-containing protein n=1 Tax=Eruca vesicaria subsp. sativa TaxID=29727 RepID=A0ABC8J6X4_ERUVS|nr:unnamed protein product [Eruca vesicaria subsp. sativa]